MPLSRGRLVLFQSVAGLLAFSLALGGAELLLRLTGHGLWRPLDAGSRVPIMHEPDPELGWKTKAGIYEVPAFAPSGQTTHVTFLDDGTRASGPKPAGARGRLALLGCSYTQGWALSDEETYAWKLQERYPSLQVANHGTAGYGTYQSLLMLERLFARPDPPKYVVYGFIEDHEQRNVAAPDVLLGMALFSRVGAVHMPYATVDGDVLRRHPPVGYPRWPLRERLATVTFLEHAYNNLRGARRPAQQRPVTERLIADMDRLCRAHDAQLLVALLSFEPGDAKSRYARFLDEHGVAFVDCVYPLTRDMQVPGEGHPNGRMNTRWADCIGAEIARRGWVGGP